MALMTPLPALLAEGPAPVNLGAAAGFTILAGAAITTTGGGVVTGDAGASPIAGSAIHLTAAQVNGTIYAVDASGPAGAVVDPSLLTTAKGDLTAAYNSAKGRSPIPTGPFLDPGAGNIGGLNLVPGLYKFTGTAMITGSDVTLTGGPNDVWIFQVAADLEVGSSIHVILAGGAQAANVFWQVGTSATLGTSSDFKGTILASQSVTMDTSSTLEGRALAFTAGVTFDGASATLPTPGDGLVLLTDGNGTIEHGAWPAKLIDGDKYTVTAVAAANNSFSNWMGGLAQPDTFLSASATYTFTMQAGLVLEASFIPSPFRPVHGVYNGLFFTPNGVTEETAGMLRGLTVDSRGTYSGTLLINGGAHAIGGRFSLEALATNHIVRVASVGGDLTVVMKLNWSESPVQVTGTVLGTNAGAPWTANLIADLATNSLPSAEYTMLLPPVAAHAPPAESPGGDGYGLITNYAGTARNPAAAVVRITGALADGAAFHQSVPVSQDGYVPIYVSLYAGKGLLLGWINLELTNTAEVSLTWIRPARAAGLYRAGFTNVLLNNQVLMSPWTDSAGTIDLLTQLSFLNTIGAGALTNFTVTIGSNLRLKDASNPRLTGSINPRTGLLEVFVGSGASTLSGFGAVLLNTTSGGGYFLTRTNAQAIEIAP